MGILYVGQESYSLETMFNLLFLKILCHYNETKEHLKGVGFHMENTKSCSEVNHGRGFYL